MESVKANAPEKVNIEIRTVGINDTTAISALVALEQRVYGKDEARTMEEFKKRLSQGEVIYALWKDNQAIGVATAAIKAEPTNKNPLRKALPGESLFVGGASVDPEFLGNRLQKILLEKRINLAKELRKETIIGTVRPENGPSLRNITNSGGRVLAYLYDFFTKSENSSRFIWEIDTTLPNDPQEPISQKDASTPEMTLTAFNKLEKRIVLLIKNGEDRDEKAQEVAKKILAGNYVGTGVQKLSEDTDGSIMNGITFRHLSTFPPEVAKRLKERKNKIQKILNKESKKD